MGMLMILVGLGGAMYHRIKVGTASESLQNRMLMGYSIVLTLLLAEGIAMLIPQTHEVGYTLSAQTWLRYCWEPLNELGYRDEKVQADTNMKHILIVGDSFTAGYGICDVNQRYSNLLAQQLPDDHHVHNLGHNGADTREAYKRLLEYPVSPDLVIVQYYSNDVDGIARDQGIDFGGFEPYQDIPLLSRPIIRGSFLANLLYWQFPHADKQPYVEFLQSAYQDTSLLNTHLHDLNQFASYAKDQGIPLIVLIFPFLRDLEGSFFVSTIEQHFQAQDIPVINLIPQLQPIPPMQRVVNKHDAHPNERVHALAAQALYETLRPQLPLP